MRNVWIGVVALIWMVGSAILFWPPEPRNPLAVETYVEELSPYSARVSGPVLYTLCDIPAMLIEPDGNGFIQYVGQSMDKRLNELEGSPIITNEIAGGLNMECRRIDGPSPFNERMPHRRGPVPDIKDHMKKWSA